MRFWRSVGGSTSARRGLLLGLTALGLAACATTNPNLPPKQEVDASGQPIIQAGDIAIAGQMVAHSIIVLPEIASATTPPLVRFSGVTSIVTGPVQTGPYTVLLRDRLLLLTREKLRFVERQLPALQPHHVKHSKDVAGPIDVDTDADYQIVARLRGNFDDDTYLLDVHLLDLHSNTSIFDADYRIRKEEENAATGTTVTTQSVQPIDPNAPPVEDTSPMPPPSPMPSPPSSDNSGLQ